MQEVVASVKHVNDIIREIALALGEQGSGIGGVTVAVNELDRMTQQSAALVEESAAAAERPDKRRAAAARPVKVGPRGD